MAMSPSSDHASLCFMVVAAVVLALHVGGSTAAPTNQLLPGDVLKTGQKISSANYTLMMQPDCNLVLYRGTSEGTAIWYTQTNGRGSECELRLQTDGNLAIHDKDGKLIWQSATTGTIGSYILLLQRDRNIVLYGKPIWDSGTGTVQTPPTTY